MIFNDPILPKVLPEMLLFFQIVVTLTSAVIAPMFSLFLMGGISRHANCKVGLQRLLVSD